MKGIGRRLLCLAAAFLIGSVPAVAADALVMGVFPRRSATLTAQLFSPLADYLGAQLGRPVRLVTAKDFPSFWEDVLAGRYDIVHYNQYHYLRSAGLYEVVACNAEQGRDVLAGALYVRRDSGIERVAQLRGKRVIFGGGEDAMMSYIVPRYLLQQGGLAAADYTALFASSPPNAVLAVYYRQAEAGGAGDVVMRMPVVNGIADTRELRLLALSAPIKQLPWALKRALPDPLKAHIRALMVGLGDSEQGRAVLSAAQLTGMSAASDADYDSARQIVEQVLPAPAQ